MSKLITILRASQIIIVQAPGPTSLGRPPPYPPTAQRRQGQGSPRDQSPGLRASSGRRAGVGNVRAVRPGADDVIEVLAELRMVVSDPADRLADGAGHAGSSPFGRRRGSSITAS